MCTSNGYFLLISLSLFWISSGDLNKEFTQICSLKLALGPGESLENCHLRLITQEVDEFTVDELVRRGRSNITVLYSEDEQGKTVDIQFPQRTTVELSATSANRSASDISFESGDCSEDGQAIVRRALRQVDPAQTTQDPNNGQESGNGGRIAGGIIGALVILAILIVIAYLVYRYCGHKFIQQEYRPRDPAGRSHRTDMEIFKDLLRIPPKERLL